MYLLMFAFTFFCGELPTFDGKFTGVICLVVFGICVGVDSWGRLGGFMHEWSVISDAFLRPMP